jgi:hypothetical protein
MGRRRLESWTASRARSIGNCVVTSVISFLDLEVDLRECDLAATGRREGPPISAVARRVLRSDWPSVQECFLSREI